MNYTSSKQHIDNEIETDVFYDKEKCREKLLWQWSFIIYDVSNNLRCAQWEDMFFTITMWSHYHSDITTSDLVLNKLIFHLCWVSVNNWVKNC